MEVELLCVIPAKGRSRRLPGKNIADLCGKPVLAYSIEAALKSKLFKEVFVSTDNQQIAKIAKEYGAMVPYIRPSELAGDSVGVEAVCLHMIDYFEQQGQHYQTIFVLLPTSPLRTAEDLRAAYEMFKKTKAKSVMAITKYVYSPFQAVVKDEHGLLKPYWGFDSAQMRERERTEVFVDSGAIYIVDIATFKKEKSFYGSSVAGYFMPPERSIDLNSIFDLKTAELLLRSD